MKFRIFLGIICLAFIAALLAYGSNILSPEPITPVQEPESISELAVEISETISCEGATFASGPLVVGFVGRPTSLLPFTPVSSGVRSQIETELSKLVFRGLVQFTPTGEPVADLASWQVAEDGLSVVFTLDQGGVWHDGTPVTAADVAFTLSILAAGEYNTPGNFPWQTVAVQVIDPMTVQLTLPISFAPLLEAATVGLLPAHLGIDSNTLPGSAFAAKPVGNGNFRVVNRWENDGLILLEPVEANPAVLERIEVRFYPSLETMSADFSAQSVDLMVLPPYTSVQALEGIPAEQYNLFSGPTPQSTQLFFKMDGALIPNRPVTPTVPIKEPAVRQALRLGLDRRTLVDMTVQGQGIPMEGVWSLENRFHNQAQFPVVQTDLSAANALLEEAGWLFPEGSLNGDPRQKNGKSLELEILVPNRGVGNQIGLELARQWSGLGVLSKVTTLSPSEYEAAIIDRQFDVTVQKIKLQNDPDLYDFWSQEAIVRGQNISHWNKRSASEALESGRQIWGYDLRKPYYDAFHRFFEQDLPAFSLFQDTRTIVVNSRVDGPMLGYPGDLGQFMGQFSQWYILEETPESTCIQDG